MVTAGRHRGDPPLFQFSIKCHDAVQTILQINRVGTNITEISTIHQLKRIYSSDRVQRTDHCGKITKLARTMPRAWPIGGAGIPRHPDKPYVNAADLL